MKTFLLFLLFFTVSCQQSFQTRAALDSDYRDMKFDEPIKVSLCDLKNSPDKYNHKLIEVTGFISQGFENFSIFDPECEADQCVWLEYGGKAKSGTIYCCGETPAISRPEPLVVENISISIVEDENFKTFDKLLKRESGSIVHATIQGRFFSGEKTKLPGGTFYLGYGHMGMCSLFAIQKVVEVDSQENKDLDYASSDHPPDEKYIKDGGGYEILDIEKPLDLQRKADNGERDWSFNDPQKVASEYLAKTLGVEETTITGIKQTHKFQGKMVYYWKDKKTKTEYTVNVSRPYWLSFYAKDKKVAWIVISAYRIT